MWSYRQPRLHITTTELGLIRSQLLPTYMPQLDLSRHVGCVVSPQLLPIYTPQLVLSRHVGCVGSEALAQLT